MDANQKVLQRFISRRKKWAHTIDGYAQLFRRGLVAAKPLLDDLGASDAYTAGAQAISDYDTIRQKVSDVDERGRAHLGRIAKAIG